MAIPTPSFSRIRTIIIFLICLIFFFLIGAIKNSFANTYTYATSPCKWQQYNVEQEKIASFDIDLSTTWVVDSDGVISLSTDTTHINSGAHYFRYNVFSVYQLDDLGNYGVIQGSIFAVYQVGPGLPNMPFPVPVGTVCPVPPCEDQKNAFIVTCGGEDYVDWSTWNEETCTGGKCCPSGNFTITNVCVPFCPYVERIPNDINIIGGTCIGPPCSSNEIEVDGKCKSNCIAPAVMDVSTGECFSPQPHCNPCEILTGGSCIAPPVCPSQTYRNQQTCECTDEEPPDCGPNHHWNGAVCQPDEVKRCDEGKIKNAAGDCVADPRYCPKGKHYDSTTKGCVDNAPLDDKTPPVDPAAADSEKLGNIAENAGKTVDNTKAIGESSERIEKLLSGISGQLDKIEMNGDGVEQGIKDGLSDLQGSIDGVDDTLENISSGSYSPQPAPEPYTTEEYDFSERTSEFLSQMKTTGIFSLPGMLSDSIPGGGSPILTIDTGETFGGIHTIDFSNFSMALTILKYLFQIAGMVTAIRIVTLKR